MASTSALVTLHAKCMHGLMAFTDGTFQLVLNQPDQVLTIKMMMAAVEHLEELHNIYEQISSATDLRVCEQQVIYVSRKYFPEMFCVSFKALEDVYSIFASG